MNKYVVVSSNNNPDYLFFIPYIEKAWNKFGWNLCIMVSDDVNVDEIKVNDSTLIFKMPKFDGIRTETVAQASRLYAANYLPSDSLIMTSDMDLLPLSDYWNPNIEDITVYGHDLTWHTFYPMGYIAMSAGQWKLNMGLTGDTYSDFMRDANNYKHLVYANDWEAWWNYDWTMITEKLKPKHHLITFIERGQVNIAGATLAKGRIDRYNWIETQKQDLFIDAHCDNNNVNHPEKLAKFLEVFNKFHS